MDYEQLIQICKEIKTAQEIEYQLKVSLEISEAKLERVKNDIVSSPNFGRS